MDPSKTMAERYPQEFDASQPGSLVAAESRVVCLPGDLLLGTGTEWVVQAVQYFDESPVSKIAVLLNANLLLEQTPGGRQCQELGRTATGSRVSAVRRWKSGAAVVRRLAQIVLEEAGSDKSRAHDPILLLALLLLIRESPVTPHFGRLVRNVLGMATATIGRMLAHGLTPSLSPWPLENGLLDELIAARGKNAVELPEECLLARVLRRPDAEAPAPYSGVAAHNSAATPDSATAQAAREAEAAFEQHVDWLWTCQNHAWVRTVDPMPLTPSIVRFASALQDSQLLPASIQASGSGPRGEQRGLEVDDALVRLKKLTSTLVTPGDLWRSPELVTLGTIRHA